MLGGSYPTCVWFSLIHSTGAIFGTGTNGAYVEKVENIIKLGDSPARKNGGIMVVNAEWGAFNNTVRILVCSSSRSAVTHHPRS